MPRGSVTERVAAFIEAQPRQRVPVSEIVKHLTDGDSALIGENLAAVVLPALLDLEERAGLVLQTRTRWDRWSEPPVPAWVQRAPRPAAVRPPRRPEVWPAALEAAAAAARSDGEFDLLDRIRAWLPTAADALVVPMEERSLALFGDEKRLHHVLGWRLFRQGYLTPELLRCRPAVSPLPAEFVPGAGAVQLLVTENRATFQSALAHHRASPEASRSAVHVGWGYGNDFPAIVRGGGITLLEPPPRRFWYFGDLDAGGLAIAREAAQAARAAGLGDLRPAEPLYRYLLDHGRPAPSSGRPTDADLAWFPESLRDEVRDLLDGGRRIAQEWVGAEALRASPSLLEEVFRS